MLKKALKRGVLGIPLGVTIGVLMLIFSNAVFAHGAFSPAPSDLVEKVGSELTAFVLEILASGIMGFGFAAGSVVWNKEDWSLARQTGLYLLVAAVCMLPAAYLLYWMPHSLKGFVQYALIFLAIFAVFWIISYIIMRVKVNKMNEKVK